MRENRSWHQPRSSKLFSCRQTGTLHYPTVGHPVGIAAGSLCQVNAGSEEWQKGQTTYLYGSPFSKRHPGKVASHMDRPKQQLIPQHFGQHKANSPYLEIACHHFVHAHVEVMSYGTCMYTLRLTQVVVQRLRLNCLPSHVLSNEESCAHL